jgi:hypothetical protein
MRTNLFLRSHFPDRSHQEGYVGAVIPRSRKFNPSRQVFGSGQIPGRPSSTHSGNRLLLAYAVDCPEPVHQCPAVNPDDLAIREY